jgi:hypothetical protein
LIIFSHLGRRSPDVWSSFAPLDSPALPLFSAWQKA